MSASGTLPPPPPPGTPFYGGLGPAVVAVSWTFCAVATIELLIRVYTRFAIAKNAAGWPLITALIAWAIGVPSSVLYTLACTYGLGNHIEIALYSPNLATGTLYIWVAACTISFAAWFGKLSAMLYVFEVQGQTYSAWRWILYFTVGVNLICYIITVPFIFTECNPSAKLWDPLLDGTCDGSQRAYVWAIITGSWGALTDAALALYPIALVARLQIKKRLKITLCALLGIGLFTAISSIVKTAQFGDLNVSQDSTYEIANLMIWGMLEMWLVLVAGSTAPLWPFVRYSGQRWGWWGGSTVGRGSSSKGWMNVDKSKRSNQSTRDDGILLTRDIHVRSEEA